MAKKIVLSFFVFFLFCLTAVTVSAQTPPAYLPNQFIVKYKTVQDNFQSVQNLVADRQRKKNSGMAGLLDYYLHNMQYRVQQRSTPEERLASLTDLRQRLHIKNENNLFANDVSSTDYQVVRTDGSLPIKDVINEYQRLSTVEWAMADTILSINEAPNDSQYAQLWGLKKIEVEKAWSVTKGSADVTVAVVDTGADYNHVDLKNNLIPGYNAIIGKAGGQDDHYHGTHVSGTIAAVSDNNQGVAGINWNTTKVMAIKALDSNGSGPLSVIASAMKYAIDHSDENHIKVINMSLGGKRNQSGQDECQTLFNTIAQQADQKNISIVVAAGNSNQDSNGFVPAGCDGFITVGASDENDKKASFSNFGTKVMLSAPGTNILSTTTGNKYQVLQGTSMASPHVAGVVALMYAANPSLTATRVKEILSSAANLDPLASSNIGAGRLNAYKEVVAAGGSQPQPTTTGTQPTTTPTTAPGVTAQPNATTAPTRIPTATTVPPTPLPTTPPYTCTPQQLPAQEANQNCACANGVCNSSCTFYSVTPTAGLSPTGPAGNAVPTVGISQCPAGFTCTPQSSCIGRIAPDSSTHCATAGDVCCFNGFNAIDGLEKSETTIQSSIKCLTSTGQDNNAFCTRSLRTAGDADGDGKVTYLDYLYAVRSLQSGTLPDSINADFNGDGTVTDADKQIILNNLKKLCY